MDLTICVGTFGDTHWLELARERAIPSAAEQAPVVHIHAKSLAKARNAALERVETEFVVFLDADDELEPGYVEAMETGTADLRAPSVRYDDGEANFPRVVNHEHACTADCLPFGNFIAIGAAVRTKILRSVGGFYEEPIWEDWSAWLRCWRAGASVESIPDAVYRAHGSVGRNSTLSKPERRRVFAQITA